MPHICYPGGTSFNSLAPESRLKATAYVIGERGAPGSRVCNLLNLCLTTLTLNVDNACRYSSFMAIVHVCKAGSAQFSLARASPGGVYLNCFLPIPFLETISQAIVERQALGRGNDPIGISA